MGRIGGWAAAPTLSVMTEPLLSLAAGERILVGGDRFTTVTPALASAFAPGDRLVVVHETGDLLHIPAGEYARVAGAVGEAHRAFGELAGVADDAITDFFDLFAARLADDSVYAPIAAANLVDVESAIARGRPTGRLVLDDKMRAGMVAGLKVWRDSPTRCRQKVGEVSHAGWSVEQWRDPLGVVGFVFEGRPNVFADATGVLRTGNTVVFRIGSDALGTARAIMSARGSARPRRGKASHGQCATDRQCRPCCGVGTVRRQAPLLGRGPRIRLPRWPSSVRWLVSTGCRQAFTGPVARGWWRPTRPTPRSSLR